MSSFWDTHKTCGEISCDECDDRYQKLYAAAQEVVDRWGTPLWKDVPATAEYINALMAEVIRNKIRDNKGE